MMCECVCLCVCVYVCVIYMGFIDFTFCLGAKHEDASEGNNDQMSTGHLSQHRPSLTCTLQYTVYYVSV